MLSRFVRILKYDGQTDGRTNGRIDRQTDRIALSISRGIVLTRDKNDAVLFLMQRYPLRNADSIQLNSFSERCVVNVSVLTLLFRLFVCLSVCL